MIKHKSLRNPGFYKTNVQVLGRKRFLKPKFDGLSVRTESSLFQCLSNFFKTLEYEVLSITDHGIFVNISVNSREAFNPLLE